jgi:hypothetical protein
LTEGVFVAKLSSDVGISVINGRKNRNNKNNNNNKPAKQQSVTCGLILRTKEHTIPNIGV